MSQLTYVQDPIPGLAGAPFDAASTRDIVNGPAAEEIPFGRLVERQVDGSIRLWRGGAGKVYGVSVRHEERETGSFAIGGSATYKQFEEVPVMRRGRIWAAYESTAVGVALAAPNVWAPTTNGLGNAALGGTYTTRATSGTVGAEITATTSTLFWKAVAIADTVCAVEVSFD